MMGQLVVFYDGQCPFCHRWVRFLLNRDKRDRLRFASLQSEWTHNFLLHKDLNHPGMDSIAVWDGRGLLLQSTAAISISAALPGIWSLGRALRIVPKAWRDGLYRFVARRRYRFFGHYEECRLPSKNETRKFLDL
jgi:predicted DCC family thiol-disulfide oxidoreductase YuxK